VLIGGAACDLWMGERELRFRATEDLDIVVIVDVVDDEFIRAFWDFIREALPGLVGVFLLMNAL